MSTRSQQQERLVARANRLMRRFGKKDLTPEGLRQSSSSMFVFLYEEMYEKLEDINRHPISKRDRVDNLNQVLIAIEELKGIELKHISGEEIVEGNFYQLSLLLEEFESDIESQGEYEEEIDEQEESYGRYPSGYRMEEIYSEEENDEEEVSGSEDYFAGESEDATASHFRRPSSSTSSSTSSSSSYVENSETPEDEETLPASLTRSSSSSSSSSYPSTLYKENQNEDIFRHLFERFPQNVTNHHRKEFDAIRSLAQHRTILNNNQHSQKLIQEKERDKRRFQKAYNSIINDERVEARLQEQRRRSLAKLKLEQEQYEKRLENARIHRIFQDMEREAKSRRLKRKDQEDRLVRSMFENAFNEEKERVIRTTAAISEAKARRDKQLLDKYQAARQVYDDQKDILNEKLLEEKKNLQIQKRNQKEELVRLSKELKKEFEEKLNLTRITLDSQEEKLYQINTNVIEKAFSLLSNARSTYHQALTV